MLPWNDGDPCKFEYAQNPPLTPQTTAFTAVTSPPFQMPPAAGTNPAGWTPPATTVPLSPTLLAVLQNPSAYPQYASVVADYEAAGLPMPGSPGAAPALTPTTSTASTSAAAPVVTPVTAAPVVTPTVAAPTDFISESEAWLMSSTTILGFSIPNIAFVGAGALLLALMLERK